MSMYKLITYTAVFLLIGSLWACNYSSISSNDNADNKGMVADAAASGGSVDDIDKEKEKAYSDHNAPAATETRIAPPNDKDKPTTISPQAEKEKKVAINLSQADMQQAASSRIQEPSISSTGPIVTKSEENTADPIKQQPDHTAWDQLLQQYVSGAGNVNYEGLKQNDAAFEAYLEALQNSPPTADWSRKEKMVYWINAYNAFTVKLILDHYPVSSIMDISNGKAWDVSWIKLGNKTYSLNQIEHDILRPQFGDARIHFAVNCAAKSCPPLHNRAFTATNLNQKLASLTRSFINNSSYNQVTENSLKLSKIFDWYAGDFGEILPYINKNTSIDVAPDAPIEFIEYDWALNR